MNIMFGGNYKVFDGMVIELLSIIKHNKEKLNVFLLTMDLPELNENFRSVNDKEFKILQNILTSANKESVITKIDLTNQFKTEMINSKNIGTGYTPYAFLRLFADDLKEIPDKVLYLDTDIVFNGNVRELYDIDVSNYEYAAARDYYGKFFFYPNYINSGVLLLNMKKVRETGLFKKVRELVNNKLIFLPDQTALNKLTTRKLIINSRFNSQKKLKKNTLIRHFAKTIIWLPWFHTLNIKPWNIELVHSRYKCYEFDDILEEYLKIKNMEINNG